MTLVLPGLDGSSLLGFLAGLGVLRAIADSAESGLSPRLGWTRTSTWSPAVTGVADVTELARRLLGDANSSVVDDVLSFEYIKREKAGIKRVQALVPPVAVLRAALESRLASGNWAAAHYLGCLMCESAAEEIPEAKRLTVKDFAQTGVVCDPGTSLNLSAGPTPFDFTSRNAQFLDQIKNVRDALTETAIVDELVHGTGTPVERIMRWDALVDMPGALFERARPMTRPVAEWLAFRGATFFPLVDAAGRARVAGLSGRRKAGDLSWVLWTTPLAPDAIMTVLGHDWGRAGRAERLGRAVAASFVVSLRKDATGYDGSVSPSRAL
jgi:hypothetical protein